MPYMSFDPVNLTALSTRKRLANAKAELIATCMQEVWEFIRTEMAKSQQTQVKTVDKHRKPSLEYKVSNLVWLSTRIIHTEKHFKKLDHKQISLYRIKKLVRSSYHLELPVSMQIHNVFYSNLRSTYY